MSEVGGLEPPEAGGLEPPEATPPRAQETSAAGGDPATANGPSGAAGQRRPLIERLGMAGIAVAIALAFGAVAAAFLAGNEPIFAAMAALGGLMTLWAGTMTLIRG